MPHMVIFRTADGKPSYHQAEVLNEAIRFVEHLRNEEQVNDARIFAMAEVPIEFKVQWRVELAAPVAPAAPAVPVPVVAPAPAPAAEVAEVAAEPEAADVDAVAAEPADGEHDDQSELLPYGEVQTAEEVGVAAGAGGASLPAASSSRFGLFNRG